MASHLTQSKNHSPNNDLRARSCILCPWAASLTSPRPHHLLHCSPRPCCSSSGSPSTCHCPQQEVLSYPQTVPQPLSSLPAYQSGLPKCLCKTAHSCPVGTHHHLPAVGSLRGMAFAPPNRIRAPRRQALFLFSGVSSQVSLLYPGT